jgi:hypothetical protein
VLHYLNCMMMHGLANFKRRIELKHEFKKVHFSVNITQFHSCVILNLRAHFPLFSGTFYCIVISALESFQKLDNVTKGVCSSLH